jgi:hypothetical protein
MRLEQPLLVKTSQVRKLWQSAFIHGSRSLPFGLLAGALLGWIAARSGDSLRDTGESMKLFALVVGFVLAPAAVAALRMARSVSGQDVSLLVGTARRILAATAAAAAWATVGTLVACGLGRLGELDLVLQPLLVTGLVFGLGVGAFVGLLLGLVQGLRGRRSGRQRQPEHSV